MIFAQKYVFYGTNFAYKLQVATAKYYKIRGVGDYHFKYGILVSPLIIANIRHWILGFRVLGERNFRVKFEMSSKHRGYPINPSSKKLLLCNIFKEPILGC